MIRLYCHYFSVFIKFRKLNLLLTPYFALFLIIILGFIIGGIKIKGVKLDVSAVLFVAMVFGYYGLEFPDTLKQIGLVLFIFTDRKSSCRERV